MANSGKEFMAGRARLEEAAPLDLKAKQDIPLRTRASCRSTASG